MEKNQSGKYCVRIRVHYPRHAWSLGVFFLASITGYMGPSYGPIDPMNFRRFQVLHYWVFPSLAIALVSWWYLSSMLTDPAG